MIDSSRVCRCLAAALLCTLALCACVASRHTVHIQPDKIGAHTRHTAVLPLVNLSTHPNAGRIVGDILATELYSLHGFSFMERTTMQRVIVGDEEELEFVMDKAVAQELGKRLGVDTVIYGSVSEYLYQRGLDQNPAVGVNLRLLDVETGEVLWAASMSEASGCFVCNDSLNLLAQKVCADMVRAMAVALGEAGQAAR